MKNKGLKENGHVIAVVGGKQIELKFCTACQTWRPIDEFYYHIHVKKDHLDCWCKSCRKQRDIAHKKEVLMKRYKECEAEMNKIQEQLNVL